MSTQNEPQNGQSNGQQGEASERLEPIVLPGGPPESTAATTPPAPPAPPVSPSPTAEAPAAAQPSAPTVAPYTPEPASGALAAPDSPAQPGPAPAQPGPAPAQSGPAPEAPAANGQAPKKLSTFLKVSIILLAALSVASIALLFIGDFEGKFERVFSTFLAFAIFVALTAFDTRRGQRNEWYPPVALIANSYILALLLIVVWMTPASWSLVWDIFWKSLVVILVTRAVVACSQLLLNMAEGHPRPLGVFALITSLLATLTGILFTAPIAIDVFDVEVPELYWRFAVAALLLTALGLSISLLLRWSYGSADREAAKRERAAALAAAPQPYPVQGQPYYPQTPQMQPQQPQTPQMPQPSQTLPPQEQTSQPSASAPAAPSQAQAQAPAPAAPAEAPELLPWPTFEDGRPLPVGPDGQPDFSALNR